MYSDFATRIAGWDSQLAARALVAALLLSFLIAPLNAATFVVTKTEDTQDGTCDADCSLREALEAAAQNREDDTIALVALVYTVDFEEMAGEPLPLDVAGHTVTITGAGFGLTTISSTAGDRLFTVRAGADLTLRGLTLSGGRAGDGGGILATTGTRVELSEVRITDCEATGSGGAIFNAGVFEIQDSLLDRNLASTGGAFFNAGTLEMNSSAIEANQATLGAAGAIGGGALTELTNTTVSGNTLRIVVLRDRPGSRLVRGGGGAWKFPRGSVPGRLVLTHATLADNEGPEAMFAVAELVARNTIFARNGPNCREPILSEGGNLADDVSCGLMRPGDISNRDSRLRPLRPNGGLTPTHAFLSQPASPAIDSALPEFCPATDQRGVARPAGACDIGALEAGAGRTFQVNSTDDRPDLNPGDNLCFTGITIAGVAECTLRAAIQESNAFSEPDLILLQAGQMALGDGPRTAGFVDRGILQIRQDLTIVGADPEASVLSGAGEARPLDVEENFISVDLRNLLIVLGMGVNGGCIKNDGDLTLTEVTLRGCSALRGGAIFNSGTLQVIRSSLLGNQAGADGGALFNAGVATISNSTLSDNRAGSDGGAIMNGLDDIFSGTLTVISSTVVENTALEGPGGLAGPDPTTLSLSIVALNNGSDCGEVVSLGNNLDSDGSCDLGPGELAGMDPLLAPLDDYDGPTLTRALMPGSPAIDAATDCAVATDQRFSNRPFDGDGDSVASCDLGAYEAPPFQPGVATRSFPPVTDFLDPQTAYRMLGSPLQLGNPEPNAIITGSLGRQSPDFWRFFRFDEPAGEYREFTIGDPLFDFESQRGFWLISREQGEVTFQGTPNDAIGPPFQMLIPPGQHQFSFPFNFPVDLDCALRRLSPVEQAALTVCDFDCLPGLGCGYFTVGTPQSPDHPAGSVGVPLRPAVGYFAINDSPLPITLPIPPICASPAPAPLTLPAERVEDAEALPLWSMQLSLSQGRLSDVDNYLGVLRDDRESGIRKGEPPSITGLALLILPDEPAEGRLLSQHYRPITASRHWTLEAYTPRPGTASLNWDLRGEKPENLWLEDLQSGELIHLTETGSYLFSTRGGRHRFSVYSRED